MRLNRRYKRNIKENLSFYIASTVLTIVSIVMFFVMNIAGSGIMDFGEVFLSEHNVEDASFTTYQPISEKDMERLEKDFDVELEAQRYINIEDEDYTVRVFSRNKEINLPEITADKAAVAWAASVTAMILPVSLFVMGQGALEQGIAASGIKE